MGRHNVAGAGDLNEYELQRAQITWCSKAVRNLECQNHLADISWDIITLKNMEMGWCKLHGQGLTGHTMALLWQ